MEKNRKDRFRIGQTFISITTPEQAESYVVQLVKEGESGYICFSDPRTVDLASRDERYREVMDNSLMNMPDGQPTMWAAKLWGLKNVQRTMAPVFFPQLIENPDNGLKHFLLGDTNETLEGICKKASEKGALIVGTYSPPFCKLDDYDYEEMAKMINDSGANLVWLALRAPKQDFMSTRLLPFLNSKICLGVGAAFRFYLGEYKMAPPLIRKLGLMGLYWGRKGQPWGKFIWGYLTDNMPFLWHLAKIPFRRLVGKKYYE